MRSFKGLESPTWDQVTQTEVENIKQILNLKYIRLWNTSNQTPKLLGGGEEVSFYGV